MLNFNVFNGSLNSTEALSKLKQETNSLTTANENLPTAGDLQNVNQILDKVIEDIEINSATIEKDTDSFFEVANNLLNGNSTSSWTSLINDRSVLFLLGNRSTETVHHRRLGVLSIVGCSVSIIGLFLTITTYLYFWRAVRSTRSVLLVNLCTVLLLAYILFLAGVNSTSQHALCTSIAVLLHYIFLTAFFLMLSEGCIIAQMVLRPLDKRDGLHALLGISYGIPLIVVIISAASSKLKGYGNDKFCWLSIDSGLFWAFAGPALVVIFTNTIITVAVIKRLFGTSAMSKRGDADKMKKVSFLYICHTLMNSTRPGYVACVSCCQCSGSRGCSECLQSTGILSFSSTSLSSSTAY
ncbi:AGRB3-like protein, partial [Mya arenaria]